MILNTLKLQTYLMQLCMHKKIPKFAAFMLLFSQQSYLKSRWTTLSLEKPFFGYKMPHKLGRWLKHLESTDTCWTCYKQHKAKGSLCNVF